MGVEKIFAFLVLWGITQNSAQKAKKWKQRNGQDKDGALKAVICWFFRRPLEFVLGVDINFPALEIFVIAASLQVSQQPDSGRLLFVVVLSS